MRQRIQERRITQEQLQQLYARREMLDQAIFSLEQKLQESRITLQLVRPGSPPEPASLATAA